MVDKEVPLVHAVKTAEKDVVLDEKGFFVIEVNHNDGLIRVEYYSNVYKKDRIVSGNLQKVFVGEKADALCDTIVKNVPDLLPEHYMYLGREIQRAQCALTNNREYEQGGC